MGTGEPNRGGEIMREVVVGKRIGDVVGKRDGDVGLLIEDKGILEW
jgi:hypothetical protein